MHKEVNDLCVWVLRMDELDAATSASSAVRINLP